MVVPAGQGAVQAPAPFGQEAALVGGSPPSIAQIVGNAEESVEGAHGQALRARQQAETVVEVARFPPGQPVTVGVGTSQGGVHGRAYLKRRSICSATN